MDVDFEASLHGWLEDEKGHEALAKLIIKLGGPEATERFIATLRQQLADGRMAVVRELIALGEKPADEAWSGMETGCM